MTITWVGHSTFLLQQGGLNILTDPIWSDRASPFAFAGPRRWIPAAVDFDRLPPIDMVLISHDHYDHLDRDTVRRLAARFPAIRWHAPLGVAATLRRFGARDVFEADWWDAADTMGVTVTAIPAQHFSGRGVHNRDSTLWCGWSLRSAQHATLFAGDTALHPEFGEIAGRLGPFDLAILPVGAYEPRWFMSTVHMNPADALKALEALGGPAGVRMTPGHWGTFKLTDEPMNEPPRVLREQWEVAGFPAERLWMLDHGETRSTAD
ncbi:MAG TPA: MBL fold metallo-hydrolase [Gemmatimonadaceae bacterium]|nr:MBL fold metallo-hydrolase [Gemmatimonadaceae bacterium]